jgi:hypothetical protein
MDNEENMENARHSTNDDTGYYTPGRYDLMHLEFITYAKLNIS